jgi:hypothetical protein
MKYELKKIVCYNIMVFFNVIAVYFIIIDTFDLYSSPSIIRIIKSPRMRWAGHVSRMGVEEELL